MATVGLSYRTPRDVTTEPVQAPQAYTPPASTPIAAPPVDWQGQLANAYKQYLGRDPVGGEAANWGTAGGGPVTNPGYITQRINDLQQTPEATNYATAHPASAAQTTSPQAFIQQWQQTHSAAEPLTGLIAEMKRLGLNADAFMYGATPSGNEITLNGQKYKVKTGDNTAWWNPSMGEGGGGGNVFSDPATSDWESLLRQVSGQLSQPQQTPDYNSLVSYLKQYMGQLQQPGYSPAEAEQIQTQSIDPLTHERDNAVQRVIQQYAAKGFRPSDGPVQQAVADVNKQYEQMRTTTHANFATQAAGLTRQNAAAAAQVGQGLQTLEQGQQTGNENRALQAVNMMFQIPTMADTRLAAANQTLAGTNASGNAALASLLQLRQQNQQQGQWTAQQEQAFWSQIGNLLVKL